MYVCNAKHAGTYLHRGLNTQQLVLFFFRLLSAFQNVSALGFYQFVCET